MISTKANCKNEINSYKYMSDDDINLQYKDAKVLSFFIEPLRNSEGYKGYFEIEFPNADDIDFESYMENHFFVYDNNGDKIAWDNWMPSNITKSLEDKIKSEISKKQKISDTLNEDTIRKTVNETLRNFIKEYEYNDFDDDYVDPDDWRSDEPSETDVALVLRKIQEKCNECGIIFKDLGENEFGVISRNTNCIEVENLLQDLEKDGIIHRTGGEVSTNIPWKAKYRVIKKSLNEEKDKNTLKKIISDLFIAAESSDELIGIKKLEDEVWGGEGNEYEFIIGYKVTERPHIVTYKGDYWTPDDFEIEGDFDFNITKIKVYEKEGKYIGDVLKSLTKEEYAKLKNLFDFDLYEIAYSSEELDEFFEPDFDALRKENLKESKIKIVKEDILYMVKRAINEVASKRTAMNRIYKVTHDITSHLYHDENWHGVTLVVDAIESLGYDCEVSVKDGGYRENDGAKWKEYLILIRTPEGFEIQGTLNCHAAGTTEDPFERYDMSLVLW